MNPKDIYSFASDRPIKKTDDDLLDRAEFAKDLALAISDWRSKDSLVIALHGEWGSGKSSIKNMTLSVLEQAKDNTPDIIQFSPWEWAAQEKITASFFDEISKSIGRKDRSKAGKKLAATLKRYGQYLNTGESIASGLVNALPTLFVLVTVLGISGSFIESDLLKGICTFLLVLLGGWAGVLKWGGGFLTSLGINAESKAEAEKADLSEIRSELSQLLADRKSPLLIVMDDLDRLTTEQLRMSFQLVKANLEFPNVVFLLLFQRDLVEKKLTDDKQNGRDYLEKIIQVPFDIPKIEISKLHSLLFGKLNQLLEQDKSAQKMFDSNRWGNLFHGALHAYFDNLRNVYRYTSTLSFHFGLFKGKSVFEVNPVDLIGIECIRVF